MAFSITIRGPKDPWGTQVEVTYSPFDEIPASMTKDGRVIGRQDPIMIAK